MRDDLDRDDDRRNEVDDEKESVRVPPNWAEGGREDEEQTGKGQDAEEDDRVNQPVQAVGLNEEV